MCSRAARRSAVPPSRAALAPASCRWRRGCCRGLRRSRGARRRRCGRSSGRWRCGGPRRGRSGGPGAAGPAAGGVVGGGGLRRWGALRVAANGVHDHDHRAALEQRHALDDAVVLQAVGDLQQQDAAAVRMRELATAEADGDLELVALIEELRSGLDLRLDVVVVDLRRDADLFPGDRALALLRFLRLLLLGVAVLAEVEDARDRRRRVRRDLDEVVAEVLRMRERTLRRDDSELLVVRADQAHGGDADTFVDPQFGSGYTRASVMSRGTASR